MRGVLHRAAGGADAVVLTHGAGSDCHAPLLVALAAAFAARGVSALRCDLPYRQARPAGPPSPAGAARDRDGLRTAVAALRELGGARVFLGGHSYGGRQASMLAAEEPAIAEALLLSSYPLHPPGRATVARTAHFPRLRVPAFFVHGTRDGFATPDELRAARALIPARTGLLAVEGGTHALVSGKGVPGATPLAERIAGAFLAWVEHGTT